MVTQNSLQQLGKLFPTMEKDIFFCSFQFDYFFFLDEVFPFFFLKSSSLTRGRRIGTWTFWQISLLEEVFVSEYLGFHKRICVPCADANMLPTGSNRFKHMIPLWPTGSSWQISSPSDASKKSTVRGSVPGLNVSIPWEPMNLGSGYRPTTTMSSNGCQSAC